MDDGRDPTTGIQVVKAEPMTKYDPLRRHLSPVFGTLSGSSYRAKFGLTEPRLEGNVETSGGLALVRRLPSTRLTTQDRDIHDFGRERGQSFSATCGWTDHFAAASSTAVARSRTARGRFSATGRARGSAKRTPKFYLWRTSEVRKTFKGPGVPSLPKQGPPTRSDTSGTSGRR